MLRGAVPEWRAFLSNAPLRESASTTELLQLCRWMRRGTLVATEDPWSVHLLCGNPAITLPRDLNCSPQLQQKVLANERPSYVVGVRGDAPQRAWVARSPLLKRVAASGRFTLYEVRSEGPRRAVWRGPPPLRCAGRGAECLRMVRRESP